MVADQSAVDEKVIQHLGESLKSTTISDKSRIEGKKDGDGTRRSEREPQPEKKVLETGVKGTVKWYSFVGRYGFIEREDKSGDVFVHQSAIVNSKEHRTRRSLADNEEVEFDVVEGRKGPEAANVAGPGGSEVKGAPPPRRFFSGPRYFRYRRPAKSVSTEKGEDVSKEENADADKVRKPFRGRRVPRRKPKRENAGQGEREAGGPRRRRRQSSKTAKTPATTAVSGADVNSSEAINAHGDPSLGADAVNDPQV